MCAPVMGGWWLLSRQRWMRIAVYHIWSVGTVGARPNGVDVRYCLQRLCRREGIPLMGLRLMKPHSRLPISWRRSSRARLLATCALVRGGSRRSRLYDAVITPAARTCRKQWIYRLHQAYWRRDDKAPSSSRDRQYLSSHSSVLVEHLIYSRNRQTYTIHRHGTS
jgi:hypothetical protein